MEQPAVEHQGLAPDRYRVIPRTLVFIRWGARVLLMRRADHVAVWPGYFNGVGGHVEPGEDLLAAARREVAEETGLVLSELDLAGLVHISDIEHRDGVLVAVFTATTEDGHVTASAEGALHWVPLEEATRLQLVPDLFEILPLLWPAGPRRIFFRCAI